MDPVDWFASVYGKAGYIGLAALWLFANLVLLLLSSLGIDRYNREHEPPRPVESRPSATNQGRVPAGSLLEVEAALASVQESGYRSVVAEVIYAMEPHAYITVGGEAIGPDGSRKVDVQVWSSEDLGLGPTFIDVFALPDGQLAGIETVETAEAKGHDLKARAVLVCSRTGFDAAAISKAKRTGVGLITVLRQGDSRATAYVEEEVYLRTIAIKSYGFEYRHPGHKPGTVDANVTYKGVSVPDWLVARAIPGLFGVSKGGASRFYYRLKQPTDFNSPGKKIRGVTEIAIVLDVHHQWLSQVVQLEAKSAIYDYVRGDIRMAGGPNGFEIKNLNFDTATPLDGEPPGPLGIGANSKSRGLDFALMTITGLPTPAPPSKVISDLVIPEDLGNDPPPLSMRKPR